MTPKTIRLTIAAVAACVLLYFFPLVRIHKLEKLSGSAGPTPQSGTAEVGGPNDIDSFIETLWTERLPQAASQAPTVDDVLEMATIDADGTRKKFGRQVGLGGPTFFFLRGRGVIKEATRHACMVAIEGRTQRVSLQTGILVSNAVRDGSGLIEVDDFPNSQDFNRLSSDLNQRCETTVIEPVRDQLVVGANVEFAGCAEVRGNDAFDPLEVIPVRLKVVAESKE